MSRRSGGPREGRASAGVVRPRGASWLVGGLGVVAALVASPACSEDAPRAAAPSPVRVGVSLALTGGGVAGRGASLRNAIRVAEGQINAAGGVLGRPIVFDVQDDRGDETAGIVDRVARGFVDEGVVAVIGPIGSEQVVKTQSIYASAHILQITPTATSPDLSSIQSKDKRWLFRTTPSDVLQGTAVTLAGKSISLQDAAATSCKKLGIVNVDNSYGNGLGDVIEQRFGAVASVTRTKLAATAAADYKKEASELLGWKPQCLAIVLYNDVAVQFLRDFKTVNPSSYAELQKAGLFVIATDSSYTPKFLELGRDDTADPTSSNVVEGVYGTAPDTRPETVQYNQFRTIYASYFPIAEGDDVPVYASNTYDAAMLVALAVQRAGTTEPTAVRNALFTVANPPGKTFGPAELGDAFEALAEGQDIDYTGASGNVDVDANGDVPGGFIVWKVVRNPDKTVTFGTVGRLPAEELTGTP